MAVDAATVKPLTPVGDRSEIALKTTAGPGHAVAWACDAAEMLAAGGVQEYLPDSRGCGPRPLHERLLHEIRDLSPRCDLCARLVGCVRTDAQGGEGSRL